MKMVEDKDKGGKQQKAKQTKRGTKNREEKEKKAEKKKKRTLFDRSVPSSILTARFGKSHLLPRRSIGIYRIEKGK